MYWSVPVFMCMLLKYCVMYCTVKTLANKDCRKIGGKNFGKLKSICIGH